MRSLQSFRLLSKMENEQFKITKYFFISFFQFLSKPGNEMWRNYDLSSYNLDKSI